LQEFFKVEKEYQQYDINSFHEVKKRVVPEHIPEQFQAKTNNIDHHLKLNENEYYKYDINDDDYYADNMNLYTTGSPKKSPELK